MTNNYQMLIGSIDEFLIELGTAGMIDGRKVRDQLLDLRLMCEKMEFELLTLIEGAVLV